MLSVCEHDASGPAHGMGGISALALTTTRGLIMAELSVIPLTPSVNPHNESWLLSLDLNALSWRGNKSVVLQMTAALLTLSVLVAQALPGQGGMTAKEVIIVASALLSVIVVGVWVRWRGKKPK